MDKEQRVAFVISQSVAALIEALGMISENLQRVHRGESMAFDKKAFDDLIGQHQIGWNDAISYLRD